MRFQEHVRKCMRGVTVLARSCTLFLNLCRKCDPSYPTVSITNTVIVTVLFALITRISRKWQLYYQNWNLYLQHFRCENSVSRCVVVANLTDAFFATSIRGKAIYLERDRQCGASYPNPVKNLSCSYNLLTKLDAPHYISSSQHIV